MIEKKEKEKEEHNNIAQQIIVSIRIQVREYIQLYSQDYLQSLLRNQKQAHKKTACGETRRYYFRYYYLRSAVGNNPSQEIDLAEVELPGETPSDNIYGTFMNC